MNISLVMFIEKNACDKNRRSSVTYSSISVFPPHPIPSRTTKYAAYKTRNISLLNISWIVRDGPRSSNCAPDELKFSKEISDPSDPKISWKHFLVRNGASSL